MMNPCDPNNKDGCLTQGAAGLVGGEKGPIPALRQYQKLRQAHPQMGAGEIMGQMMTPGHIQNGKDWLAQWQERHIHFFSFFDEDYPEYLRHIPDPPFGLFYCGNLSGLQHLAVGVVGSRKCTNYGLQTAKLIAGGLAKAGVAVVSGLALGIDAQAHASTLGAQGTTIAVLGSGLNVIYPKEHRGLARDIIHAGGAVLSEFPPGMAPLGFHFPIRNRIISGLSSAVIVVEATEKSGSLITARHCLDQGRELFAVPGLIRQPTAAGTNRLIAHGEAQLFISIEQVLDQIAPQLRSQGRAPHLVKPDLEDGAWAILSHLEEMVPISLDDLAQKTNLEAGSLMAALTELEIKKLVERRPGLLYLKNPLNTP